MNEVNPNSDQNPQGQTIIVNQRSKTNGIGTAGFILSIIALVAGCLPIIGWTVWFLGLLFSFIGIFSRPRGLAIAGLVISLIGFVLFLFVFSTLAIFGILSEGF
ncbi:hypothetical protein [Arenibacter certesii]|uniref:DUF4190 domain-containing protein n=1 Tax=Arenibacter certesii TaxID=228955 RepID=A0A918J459_9FLAO|nr:hypothetical protein [Arenibacter certesii]GGW47098.1 hypothetical protein GCM10007383_34000 [Arenibacter certesii]